MEELSTSEHIINVSDNVTSTMHHSRESSFVVTVLLVISILALLDNLMVVFILFRNRSWLKRAHSNLILVLAATDIFTAICVFTVPSFIHDHDVYPIPPNSISREFYCRLIWSHYVVFSLGVTSIYTCLFLAIERWLAIAKPVFYKHHIHSKKVIITMLVLPWIAGFTFESSSVVYTTGLIDDNHQPNCKWNQYSMEQSASIALTIISFSAIILIPGLLVIGIYMNILTRANVMRRSASQRGAVKKSRRDFKRITLMAGLASIALIICWLPIQVYSMLGQLGYVGIHGEPHRWFTVLALFNTCLNPFIYAFSNSEYRQEFMKVFGFLTCWKCCKQSYNVENVAEDDNITAADV